MEITVAIINAPLRFASAALIRSPHPFSEARKDRRAACRIISPAGWQANGFYHKSRGLGRKNAVRCPLSAVRCPLSAVRCPLNCIVYDSITKSCSVAKIKSGRGSRGNRCNESTKSTCVSRTVSSAHVGGLSDRSRDFRAFLRPGRSSWQQSTKSHY
jgi:hypothetical protein